MEESKEEKPSQPTEPTEQKQEEVQQDENQDTQQQPETQPQDQPQENPDKEEPAPESIPTPETITPEAPKEPEPEPDQSPPPDKTPQSPPKPQLITDEEYAKIKKLANNYTKKATKLEKELKELVEQKSTAEQTIKEISQEIDELISKKKKIEIDTQEKADQLEEKNKSLVQVLEKGAPALPKKDYDFEGQRKAFREVNPKLEQAEKDYKQKILRELQLAEEKRAVDSMRFSLEQLEIRVSELKKREEEETALEKEAKEHGDSHQLQKTSEELDEKLKSGDERLSKLKLKLQEEKTMNQDLAAQIENLQANERKHELQLEEETQGFRDEIHRLKMEQASKEYRSKENERINSELKEKIEGLEQQLKAKMNELRSIVSNKDQKSPGKYNYQQERKQAEQVLREKNEIKSEADRLSRETRRLEVQVRDLEDLLKVREDNFEQMKGRLGELDTLDKEAVDRMVETELKSTNPKTRDAKVKSLVELVILKNIELKRLLAQFEE